MPEHPRTLLALALAVGALAGLIGQAGLAPTAAPAAAARQAASHKQAKSKKKHKAIPPSEVLLSSSLTSTPGAVVTMPPVGLSMEYPVMAAALGSGACPAPALVSTLRELGSPPISLAGQSQDMTAPPGALTSPASSWEAATTYNLPSQFWAQMHCLLSATGDPVTVGLDARAGTLAWAQQMVGEAQGAVPSGLSFSIGNEPDLYYLPNYSSLDKTQAGEEAAAVSTYLRVAGYLEQAVGGAPLVGPELARPEHWRAQLNQVVGQLHDQVMGVHMYPLSACVTPKAVTVGGLLDRSVGEAPTRMSWVIADAAAEHVPAIISEANSASCGGVAGVSNSPATAVWAVRFVISALRTGFHEVRFHFSGDPYDPFVVSGSQVLPRPIEPALVALNQWLPVGSTIRGLTGVRELSGAAIGQPSGSALVVLDNESGKPRPVLLKGAQSVHVQIFDAALTGLHPLQLSAVAGKVRFTLAPNSVACLSWTAAAGKG
jgi:hypothetical protein